MNTDQQTGDDRVADDQTFIRRVAAIGVKGELDDGDLKETERPGREMSSRRLTMANPLSRAEVSLTLSSLDLR